jgi:hypothetical protein
VSKADPRGKSAVGPLLSLLVIVFVALYVSWGADQTGKPGFWVGLVIGSALLGLVIKWLAVTGRDEAEAAAANEAAKVKVRTVSDKRDHNRAWIRYAREQGAKQVTIWFAVGEYDDATEVEVTIREALGVLAEHVKDFHVDAVGRRNDEDVTVYLSEYVEDEAVA